jgi:hypothetical protein
MSIIITNISTRTLEFDDLGFILTYGNKGIMAQNRVVAPGATAVLVETDNVRNSLLVGDVAKYINAGYLTLVAGTPYATKQVVMVGTFGTALGLGDVIGVTSVQAYVTATGAPVGLLSLTTDYTVANGDITCVTDQTLNTLVITYTTL